MASVLRVTLGGLLGVALAGELAAPDEVDLFQTNLLQYAVESRAPAEDGQAAQRANQDTEVKQAGANTTDPCACMNWKNVYKTGMANCGDGLELNQTEVELHPDYELCHNAPGYPNSAFYLQNDHAMCIKVQKSTGPEPHPYPGTWCWVHATCQALNGGKSVNPRVSYKKCGKGDSKLGDLTPGQLFTLADKKKIDHQMIALMAYPWAGPMGGPNVMSRDLSPKDIPGPGVFVGPCSKIDCFKIIDNDEMTVWDVQNTSSCVQHCSSVEYKRTWSGSTPR